MFGKPATTMTSTLPSMTPGAFSLNLAQPSTSLTTTSNLTTNALFTTIGGATAPPIPTLSSTQTVVSLQTKYHEIPDSLRLQMDEME